MIINRQNQFTLDLPALREYERQVASVLDLGQRHFNICFVSDEDISRMNSVYRGKAVPTDVLSFPWEGEGESGPEEVFSGEFRNFLGDIVISVATAERNAKSEGHSTAEELRMLILHGVLHLLGYDHEADHGEMKSLELSMRERLNPPATGPAGEGVHSTGQAG
ncbi:MAG: rRNA maturation RNase YbeY [Acidobacteria bacterium]|nr:MAG: rRNA maturation RNase YbeY [Acidobacteriota bacterium]